jgi:hypothetical protein
VDIDENTWNQMIEYVMIWYDYVKEAERKKDKNEKREIY